jgi:hypothetical protein
LFIFGSFPNADETAGDDLPPFVSRCEQRLSLTLLLSATLLATAFLRTTGALPLFLLALALAAALLTAPLLFATLATTLLAAALAAFTGWLSWLVRILSLFHVYLSLFFSWACGNFAETGC